MFILLSYFYLQGREPTSTFVFHDEISTFVIWESMVARPSPVRRLGYGRTSTTWAACTCLRSAQRWKTSAPWSECVRFKPHWENRGEANVTSSLANEWRSFFLFILFYINQYGDFHHGPTIILTLMFSSITESCSWGSRAKSWTSWRTRTPTWCEVLGRLDWSADWRRGVDMDGELPRSVYSASQSNWEELSDI